MSDIKEIVAKYSEKILKQTGTKLRPAPKDDPVWTDPNYLIKEWNIAGDKIKVAIRKR